MDKVSGSVLFCVNMYINKKGKVMFGEGIVLQVYQTWVVLNLNI